MDVTEFLKGSNLNATNLPKPYQILTIQSADRKTLGSSGAAGEKVCLTFWELPDNYLSLNITNLQRIVALYGPNTEQWRGQRLLVYRTMTAFDGKPVLGIRVWDPQGVPKDQILDVAGNVVAYPPQPLETQLPVAAPFPSSQPQSPDVASAPWEIDDPTHAQKNNPPAKS